MFLHRRAASHSRPQRSNYRSVWEFVHAEQLTYKKRHPDYRPFSAVNVWYKSVWVRNKAVDYICDQVFTPPVAAGWNRVVRTSVIDARPDGAGRLMLHWNPTDALLTLDSKLSPSMPEARDLVRRARQLLPSIGEVEPEAVRIALRPIPGDHLSAIGPVPRTSGYYLAVTHSGVTMSPFLGAAVADEVVRGKQRRELDDFRPARFFN